MNILKESLFSSSQSPMKTKDKRSRRNHSKTEEFHQQNNSLSEPLLSPSDHDTNNVALGLIDLDDNDDNNKKETKLNIRQVPRSRHAKQRSTPAAHAGGSIVIVEKPILPQETIQTFAIRYRVPVSQLKRLNNLQNDQDFYALKYCRVPVRRFGLLHGSSSTSTIVDLNEQVTENISSSSSLLTKLSQQNHHAFLNAMDRDLASMRAKVEQLIETPTSTTTTTTLISDQPSTKMLMRSTTKTISELNCDGADCGCKFWHIILAILFIALLIPLIYIYIYVKSPSWSREHFPI